MKATSTRSLPTLYVQGAADGVNPPTASKDVPGKFTGPFAFVTLAGVSHFSQRENPDAVARHLIHLFTGNPATLSDTTDRSLMMTNAKPMRAAVGVIAAAAIGATAYAQTRSPRAQIVKFDHQATGVAVSTDGRRFVNFPRWTDDAPISVAEVMKDGSLKPYPDVE